MKGYLNVYVYIQEQNTATPYMAHHLFDLVFEFVIKPCERISYF